MQMNDACFPTQIFTDRQGSCGKVMFSLVCVCSQGVGYKEGVGYQGGRVSGGHGIQGIGYGGS